MEFVQAAQSGRIRAVEDDSYNREFSMEVVASVAWVEETRESSFQWEYYGLLRVENNSFYGEELYGICLILKFVKEMWKDTKYYKEILVSSVII